MRPAACRRPSVTTSAAVRADSGLDGAALAHQLRGPSPRAKQGRMASPIDALRDLGPRRTLFGAEALPRLPSSQKREPLRDRTNTTQKWSSERKKRPPKPKPAPRNNKPLKRPDTGAAPPNLRRRRVRIATISPESTLEAQHVELKQPSPAQKRRARRKARKLNRRSNAWDFASPDVGTKLDPQTVTPSPEFEGTPNRRSRRAPRSAPYSNSGRHDGALVLTSLTPGSDERLKRTLRRAAAVHPSTTPHQLPLINDATPIINETRASPEELTILDPSPMPTPRSPTVVSPQTSPSVLSASAKEASPEVDALFEPAMMRCVTRTKLLEYLEEDCEDTVRLEDDDCASTEDEAELTFRGETPSNSTDWSWRYDFMEEQAAPDDSDDDDDRVASPPLNKADDALDDMTSGEGDDDPFAAPPPQLAATFKVNAPVKVFPLFAQFPANPLGNQRLLPIDEDAPLLVDVNGDPLLDADAVSRETARRRSLPPGSPARPQFRRRAAALRRRSV